MTADPMSQPNSVQCNFLPASTPEITLSTSHYDVPHRGSCKTPSMTIETWWPALAQDAKTWLIENNGDDLTSTIATAINAAGGSVSAQLPLSDEQIDWIEAVGNDEIG